MWSFDKLDQRLLSKDPLDRSGVWRFRELILPIDPKHIVSKPEGNTNLYTADYVANWVGLDRLQLKHEGENPTGSFKDRGMTVAVSMARALGMNSVACASTGNTSASMAAYAAQAGMKAFVFIPEGNIAFGKLAQALAYGATTIQIPGDFDAAMRLVQEVCESEGVYLVNSVNPFRIEGQKAIAFELLQDRAWKVPDWIVLPGGNLGNNTAISKGLMELMQMGLIDRLPRIAVVQAAGAAPLVQAWERNEPIQPVDQPETKATAIRIGNPISWRKSLRGLQATRGVVLSVTDQEIFDAKAVVDRQGIGAEPASCASVAGMRKLIQQGVIASSDDVVGILTGHVLKDPDAVVKYHLAQYNDIQSNSANAPRSCAPELSEVLKLIRG